MPDHAALRGADAGQTLGLVPLPFWGIETAATFQNLPGIPILASYVATNAQIAPSLGRNLGQCGTAATCNGTVTIANVFAPNTEFDDRLTQVDVRLLQPIAILPARLFRVGAQLDF